MLLDELAREPGRRALGIGDRTASRGELEAAARRMASFLKGLGLRRGDVVCMWLPDGGPWLQILFACSHLGILAVPISTRYRQQEAKHVLATSHAKCVFVATDFLGADFLGAVAAVRGELPALAHVIPVSSKELFCPVDDKADETEGEGIAADPLCVFSTSGTTSLPKLAVHDQGGIRQHARNVARRLDLGPGDVILGALPLYGVLGFTTSIAALLAGGSCSFLPVFDAAAATRIMDRDGVTHVYGSDSLLDMLLSVEGTSLQSWRHGGFAEFAGLGEQVMVRAEERLGVRLIAVYGSSECFAVTSSRLPSNERALRLRAGGKTVSPEINFRVVDPDTGKRLEDGETGELQIRGYNVMTEYLNNPEATARALTPDGWFRTGDAAIAYGDEFIFLSRMNDSLRLRGYLVDPGEIEAYIAQHPAVSGAQVVGVKRRGEGDVAVAFVTRRTVDVTEESLLDYCRAGIANYKVPRHVAFVDRFPSVDGPNGTKILKTELRTMAQALVPSQEGELR
jgi:acyl-CoA synthetase (AMP-forming)/AMP-acid ligase II